MHRLGHAPVYRRHGQLLVDDRPLRNPGLSPNHPRFHGTGFLGVAAIYGKTLNGPLEVDLNTIHRAGPQPNLAGDPVYDEDYDDDEFAYDEDELGYSDEDSSDDDDSDDDEIGRRPRKGQQRRIRRRRKRRGRREDRDSKRESRNEDRGGRRRGSGNRGGDWQATLVSGSKSEAAPGTVVVDIIVNHAFKAENIFFDGSSAGARITTIIFGDDLVWKSATGIPTAALTGANQNKGLLKGASVLPNSTISITGSIANANDELVVTINGKKPKRSGC